MPKHMTDRGISIRAVEAIERKCHDNGRPIGKELESIGVTRQTYYSWQRMETIPSVYALQGMVMCGYNVNKILK